jgi:hypothetical protein
MVGSAPTNTQAVDFERQQAAEAAQKEADRQARLQKGQDLIDQIFNGAPEMTTTNTPFDWSTFTAPTGGAPGARAPSASTASGVPEGYTATLIPGKSGTAGGQGTYHPPTVDPHSGNATGYGYYDTGSDGTAGSAATWGLEDASGKIYNPGDPLSIATQTPTGKTTGGFDDSFYNKYNQKVLDYYNPQESRQYDTAQRDLRYSLARAGTLQSSTAADKQGELAYSDALNKADIVANANKQTGALRDQIQANKESLINQLYATEDPTLTANLAQSSVNATKLQDPTLTPVANLFTPIAVGATSYLNAATSPYSLYGAQGAKSPTPASASENRGKLGL